MISCSKRWLIAKVVLSVVIGLSWQGIAWSQQLYYKYENFDGVVVIDDSVPPELVHKGYTVLNAQGRVVR